jgi:hypothetical protein
MINNRLITKDKAFGAFFIKVTITNARKSIAIRKRVIETIPGEKWIGKFISPGWKKENSFEAPSALTIEPSS